MTSSARSIRAKWRPRLSLVLAGVLGSVLCLPMAGLFVVRWLLPQTGFRGAALLVGAAMLLLTAVLGAMLWRLIQGPVSGLAQRARELKAGDQAATEPLDHYGTQ